MIDQREADPPVPGDKLQFKRPRFFQDRMPLVSLPFYSLSLFAKQLFAISLSASGRRASA